MLGQVVAAIIVILFVIGSTCILIDIYTDDEAKPTTYNEFDKKPKSNYVHITDEDMVLAEALVDDLDFEMDTDLLE